MAKKYQNLDVLLAAEAKARAYYEGLPDYARDHISTRSQSVNSLDSLQDYAENLLRGDG